MLISRDLTARTEQGDLCPGVRLSAGRFFARVTVHW
jgi:hypothetical protein